MTTYVDRQTLQTQLTNFVFPDLLQGSIKSIFGRIKNIPSLTKEDANWLISINSKQSRDLLVYYNARILYRWVYSFSKGNIHWFKDIFTAGICHLLELTERWDVSKDCSFITFLYNYTYTSVRISFLKELNVVKPSNQYLVGNTNAQPPSYKDFSHTNPMVQYDMERYIDYRRAKGRIRDFISTLPTRHRNILTDYFNGLSCAEISRNLNVSRQAVHAIITKYKNKLKKEVVNVKPFKSKNNETCSCNRREYTAG